ncbi:hypothetical protein [Streptomyces sp. NPDC056069]|uniref:hypothetical protein n=1 Tax=Streptomyces sp. NPDC056069 TaxID=3345702 RepID=UPI0035DA70F7
MPSAEHAAVPQPPVPGRPGTATVIHLAKRRTGARTTPEPAAVDPKQNLAFTMQAMFTARGLSLLDPPTADAFGITLDAVLLMVDGAYAQNIVDEAEWQSLRAMFEDMREAPELV